MCTFSFVCQDLPRKSKNFRRQFPATAPRLIPTKPLQPFKENPGDWDKDSFNATVFHRCYIQLSKSFSPRFLDQADSGSPLPTLLVPLLK